MKIRNLMVAVIVTIAWAGLILLFSANSNSGLGKSFSLYAWIILTRYVALISAVVMLFIRVLFAARIQRTIAYALPGVVNFILGLLFTILAFAGNPPTSSRLEYLPSMVLGGIILYDILFLS